MRRYRNERSCLLVMFALALLPAAAPAPKVFKARVTVPAIVVEKAWKAPADDGATTWDLHCSHVVEVMASSTAKPEGKHRYDARNLVDGNLGTVWVEGVKGLGVGEWVEYSFISVTPDSRHDGSWAFFNGYNSSEALFKANARVKKLRVSYNGRDIADVEVLDVRSMQLFDLGTLPEFNQMKKGDKVRFKILEVYPGTKYEDTVITELMPLCAPG